jgi:cytochrome P450 PksS
MVDRDLGSELFSFEGRRNPHSIYARLRAEGRVHRMVDPYRRVPLWIVTRYADCVEVLKDPRLVKSLDKLPPEIKKRYSPLGEGADVLQKSMISADPPDHGRLRRRVQRVFSPQGMEVLRERVQAIADELLDRVAERGQMDLIADYAFPLPVTVIAELLGVPSEHRERFRRWSRAILNVTADPADLERGRTAIRELQGYFREVLAEREKSPRGDIASLLGEAGELSPDERLAMMFLLLVAGHETTVNLIGNSMLALFRNPDERRRLAEDPAIVASAVEEMLRFESPAEMSSIRFALEDFEIAGTRIPAGEAVVAGILSANRDEAEFAEPDRLDLTRAPNRHIAFGFGIHFCLGAPLSRVEGAVAFPALLRRLPNLRLAVPPDSLRWSERLILRGIQAMPVTF